MDTFRFVPAAGERSNHLAPVPRAEVIETPGFNYVGEALVEFARCVLARCPYPISHHDILHGVEVLEAAVCSVQTGAPVPVRDERGRTRMEG